MNLLKFKSFSMLLAMAAALSLTACREEILPGDDGTVSTGTEAGSGKVVYLTAGIALPTSAGTRSGTDNYDDDDDGEFGKTNSDGYTDADGEEYNDYEYGYDYENDVRTMILVIASQKNEYVAHTVITEIAAEPVSKEKFDFKVNGEIKYEDLEAAYDEENGVLHDNQTVRIFVYCNYTGRLLDKFTTENANNGLRGKTDWLDWTGEVIESASPAGQSPAISNTIWAPRSFLMTNARIFEVEFPEDINGWEDFADKNHPYLLVNPNDADEAETTVDANSEDYYATYADQDLSPIRVERSAARLDFRDGSKEGNNTYKLTIDTQREIIVNGEDGVQDSQTKVNKDVNLFNIHLTRMALVNMSKHFYYFRRVSDDGTPQGVNFNILGREYATLTNANYVVDTDWKRKSAASAYNADVTDFTNATFYYPGNAKGIEGEDSGFNFVLYNNDNSYNRDGWYTDAIDDILDDGAKADTWGGPNSYKIWRYVTENTIPGSLNQTTVQSTGIVFKGSIIPGVDMEKGFDDETPTAEPYVSKAVQNALRAASVHLKNNDSIENDEIEDWEDAKEKEKEYNYPILYSFEGMLYASIDEVITGAAQDGHNGSLFTAVTKILSNWKLVDNKFKYSKEISDTDDVLTVDTYYAQLNYEAALEAAKKKTSEFDETSFNDDYAKKYPNYDKVVDWTDGLTDDDTKDDLFANMFMKLAPAQDITIYKASDETDGEGWGYYCYYFYWNRHNDNGKSGEMGPMEFATVRNNVYKLAVTGINSFGHPRVTVYDPDPEKPWDPDEPRLRYIQVQVEVLPWVVRVNDIEF